MTGLPRDGSLITRAAPRPRRKSGKLVTLELISLSAKNERLTTQKDRYDSPDSGFYAIHRSIFRLLEVAPLKVRWLTTLYQFLDRLNFAKLNCWPKDIDSVISRWAEVEYDGKPYKGKGQFTRLSLTDEFRCLIAAMYGGGYSDGKSYVHGSPTASDVALRCAYYGKAELALDEMKEGYKRDGGAYVFASLLNFHMYDGRERTKLFEDQLSNWTTGDAGAGLLSMIPRYHNYLEQLRHAFPQITGRISRFEEAQPKNELSLIIEGNELMAGVKTLANDSNKKVNGITKQLERLSWTIPVLGFLALLIYLKK